MQKSRTRYSTTYGYRTQIGNYKMDQGVASNMDHLEYHIHFSKCKFQAKSGKLCCFGNDLL